MTIYDAMKQDWVLSHKLSEEQFEILSQVHPDERMERCPNELFNLPEEVEYRHGNGFVLGDGAWYDPISESFFYFETVEEYEGVCRVDGVDKETYFSCN
jgi:hypothetical protein